MNVHKSVKQKNNTLDYSTITLLISNVLVILFAVIQQWDLQTILWSYWVQSIIIGFFITIKIILKKEQSSIPLSFFFVVHYGFFHFIYAIFLASNVFVNSLFNLQTYSNEKILPIIISSIVFFIHHFFSFVYHKKNDLRQDIKKTMFSAYKRIIPMHVTIIGLSILSPLVLIASFFLTTNGLINRIELIIFFSIKTIVDIYSHIKIHQKNKDIIEMLNALTHQ